MHKRYDCACESSRNSDVAYCVEIIVKHHGNYSTFVIESYMLLFLASPYFEPILAVLTLNIVEIRIMTVDVKICLFLDSV